MNTIPTLTTPRMTLRPLHDTDTAALYRIMSEPDVMRFFPNPRPPTEEQVGRMIAHQLRHWEEHENGWWAVELRETCRMIGWCGLQYLPESDETEVAYLLDKAVWGRGLATEAARAALRYGFENQNLDRIIAIVHPDNLGSQKVALKVGLAFVDRTCYFQMDCFRYALDAEHYRPAKQELAASAQ